MSRIAICIATAAMAASLLFPMPARAGPEARCIGGFWEILEEDETTPELTERLAVFRRAVKATQALALVSHKIEVRAIDCATYGYHIRVVARFPTTASGSERLVWSSPEYTLYVPLALLEMDPVEIARTVRKHTCAIESGGAGELTSVEVAACELRAAIAAGDDEPEYRQWLLRRVPE